MTSKPPMSPQNQIHTYWHCRQCIEELPVGESPESWARLSVGDTPHGIQVWCSRHRRNICHIDFQGQTHPAITYTKEQEDEHNASQPIQ